MYVVKSFGGRDRWRGRTIFKRLAVSAASVRIKAKEGNCPPIGRLSVNSRVLAVTVRICERHVELTAFPTIDRLSGTTVAAWLAALPHLGPYSKLTTPRMAMCMARPFRAAARHALVQSHRTHLYPYCHHGAILDGILHSMTGG